MTDLPTEWATGHDWEINNWAMSLWEVKVDEEGASDPASNQGPWHAPPRVAIDPATGGPAGLSTAELYAIVTKDWPEVPAVIPAEKFVNEQQRETVRAHFGIEASETIQCFSMAYYQLGDDYRPSGNAYEDPDTILVQVEWKDPAGDHKITLPLPESERTPVRKVSGPHRVRTIHRPHRMVKGLLTIQKHLNAGRPLILGTRLLGVPMRPNDRGKTDIHPANHYVTAVGTSQDAETLDCFVQYYNYAKEPDPKYRFRLTPDLRLLDNAHRIEVVEVRVTS